MLRLDMLFAAANTRSATKTTHGIGRGILNHVRVIELGGSPNYSISFIFDLDKPVIVSAIKTLSCDEQIFLFKQCLNPNTVLGQRMRVQEGLKPCSLKNGTLKEIRDLLDELTIKPDVNPVTDDNIFKL